MSDTTRPPRPHAVLVSPKTLTKQEVEQLRREWAKRYQGRGHAWKPRVLLPGMMLAHVTEHVAEKEIASSRCTPLVDRPPLPSEQEGEIE